MLRRIVREQWLGHVVGYPFGEMQPGARSVEPSTVFSRTSRPRLEDEQTATDDVFDGDEGIDPRSDDDDEEVPGFGIDARPTLDPSTRSAIHIQRW